MKKTTTNLFILLSAILLICVGCDKETADGIYQPDKQISKIYTEMAVLGMSMETQSETWFWNDNRLEKIVDNTWGGSTVNFYYDGDRLSKITNRNTVLSISYKENKFDKIQASYDNYPIGTFTFKHNNGKITEVTYVEPGSAKGGKASNSSMNRMLEFLLPAHTSKILSKEIEYLTQNASPKAGKSEFQVVLKFSWNGDNVKKITIVESEDGEKDKEVSTYGYDKNKNPFTNFFGGGFNAVCASANNIISVTTRYDGDSDTETYPTRNILVSNDLFPFYTHFSRASIAAIFSQLL